MTTPSISAKKPLIPVWVIGFINLASWMHSLNSPSLITMHRDQMLGFADALHLTETITKDQYTHLYRTIDTAYSQSLARIGAI